MKETIFTVIIVVLLLTRPGNIEEGGFPSHEYHFVCISDNSEEIYINHQLNEFNRFAHRIGFLESTNNYMAVNGSYIGKYQFGAMALEDLGIDYVDRDLFLSNAEFQDRLFYRWIKLLHKVYLKDQISKYTGKAVVGIEITEAGIIAGSHLGGNGSVKRFFQTGGAYDFFDANGTRVSQYMHLFSDMKVHFNFDIITEEMFIEYREKHRDTEITYYTYSL